MELRPYQEKAIDQIYNAFRSGVKKVCLHLDTGSGKTVIFSRLLISAREKGKNAVMAVRGRQLVQQAHERLFREGVNHGVFMSGHYFSRPYEKIQICSIDTVISRRKFPKADIIVIDEAHLAGSPGYIEFAKMYPDAYFLCVTATPHQEKSIRHVADKIIRPITFDELVKQKYLVAPRYFAPSSPDLSDVAVSSSTKDYVTSQLENPMNTLTGDIVETWQKHGQNRPTILFAVSLKHSQNLVSAFLQAGIPADHVDAKTPDSLRKQKYKKLETGQIKILSSVGVLTTGVDIPCVSCIISARPTKSEIIYRQQLGRGTRIAPGKDDFLVFDHANNISNHGFIQDEKEGNLDGKPKKENPGVKICQSCFGAYRGPRCPLCGFQNPVEEKPRNIETVAGELVEIVEGNIEWEVKQLKVIAKKKGYKQGWIWHRIKAKYGEQVANEQMPKRVIPHWLKSTYGVS